MTVNVPLLPLTVPSARVPVAPIDRRDETVRRRRGIRVGECRDRSREGNSPWSTFKVKDWPSGRRAVPAVVALATALAAEAPPLDTARTR